MAAPAAKAGTVRVPIRSPAVVPEPPPFRPPPLPRDPFPPQFLDGGETVLASVKPLLRAYLGWPAWVAAALSLGALASLAAVPAAAAPVPSILFVAFAVAFGVNNLLWSRWLGRNLLILLPVGFFVGFIVSVLASVPSQSITPSQVRSIAGAELPVFAVLEIGLPVAIALVAWWNASDAVTTERVIEVRGVYTRVSRWILLPHVGRVRGRFAFSGRRLGYGRIRFEDRTPGRPHARGWTARLLSSAPIGAEFFGVPNPEDLAARIEEIIAPARVGGPAPEAAPPVPAATGGPGSAPGAPAPPCPTCRSVSVYVPAARRFYCTSCARYLDGTAPATKA